jgi:type II secretory pathway pseudopilin PulG
MKSLFKKFRYGEKGFTLVEVLAAVAVPNVGSFISKGKNESYETELHNIQTAVMAMLADSDTALLDDTSTAVNDPPSGATATDDLSTVQTTDTTALVLSDYMTGLDGTKVRSKCTYQFGTDGTVVQTPPSP